MTNEQRATEAAAERRRRRQRRMDQRLREDSGYIAAMTALLMLPLMVFTAFAVDAGSWYAQGAEQQRTADAAALAGVVYLPDFGRAQDTARDVAKKNGYEHGRNATVRVERAASNRLKVDILSTGEIFFARAAGRNQQELDRSATAEFLVSIPMGSPLNFSGIDPDIANATSGNGNYPSFWNNSSGYTGDKEQGDRFTSGGGAAAHIYKNNCTNPKNCDYDQNGYVYVTKVAATHGSLDIQVYDPAAIDVGDQCKKGNSYTDSTLVDMNNGDIGRITTQFAAKRTISGGSLNVARRWGKVNYDVPAPPAAPPALQQPNAAANLEASRYCNGDFVNNWVAGSANNPKTTWIVRAPDDTPYDYLDNPPICAITFDSYSGKVYNKLYAPLNPQWDTTGPMQTATEKVPFWKHFRNWFSICKVSSPVAGNYIVQVRNNANTSNLGATPQTTATPGLNVGTLTGPGTTTAAHLHNRYSIRAGWDGQTPAAALMKQPTGPPTAVVPTPAWAQDLSVFAESRFPIYTNQGNSLSTFYLSRITPEYRGSKVRLNLYDIGDGADVDLAIRAPADASTNPTESCEWQRWEGNTGVPDLTFPEAGPGCSAVGMKTGRFNGRLTTVTIQLAADYDCDDTTPLGCWFLIDITPKSGGTTDTTTWSADVLGNPLHLVE